MRFCFKLFKCLDEEVARLVVLDAPITFALCSFRPQRSEGHCETQRFHQHPNPSKPERCNADITVWRQESVASEILLVIQGSNTYNVFVDPAGIPWLNRVVTDHGSYPVVSEKYSLCVRSLYQW